MCTPHMIVDAFSLRESLQAYPTSMCVAARARHMVTSLAPLNRRPTSRTFLHVVRARPLLKQLVHPVLPIRASNTFVILNVTVGTYSTETGRAADGRVTRTRTIDLGTIRSSTLR